MTTGFNHLPPQAQKRLDEFMHAVNKGVDEHDKNLASEEKMNIDMEQWRETHRKSERSTRKKEQSVKSVNEIFNTINNIDTSSQKKDIDRHVER